MSCDKNPILRQAHGYPKPEIVNSHPGSQYTANEHVNILVEKGISISIDAKGRSIDNICIEPFWRSIKYEEYRTINNAKLQTIDVNPN